MALVTMLARDLRPGEHVKVPLSGRYRLVKNASPAPTVKTALAVIDKIYGHANGEEWWDVIQSANNLLGIAYQLHMHDNTEEMLYIETEHGGFLVHRDAEVTVR